MKRINHIIRILVLLLPLFISCKKEQFNFNSDALLSVSMDTVRFDTVFTTTGSITQSFKIFNDNDEKLLINQIQLMGGINSPFDININGTAGPISQQIEIAAKDSIYVFVSVLVDPTNALNPFLLRDSIQISFNGNHRLVQLEAYGQNAHFIKNLRIDHDTSWNNDLPYVLLNELIIDSGKTLLIQPGCKIFCHANARIRVNGTLLAEGTATEKISFSGDRLDEPYRNFPGSWPGIYFSASSMGNRIQYATIQNAYQALVLQEKSIGTTEKLFLSHSIIHQAALYGINCFNSSMQVDNCLISNCGTNLNLNEGGIYNFTHCTFVGYSTNYQLHDRPVAFLTNYSDNNGTINTFDMNARFINCIFWGDNPSTDQELLIDKLGNNSFLVEINHCLIKNINPVQHATQIQVINNIDPVFDRIDYTNNQFDFHTNTRSAPGIDKGISTGLSTDLDNNNRNIGLPDLGCYEKQ